jgi:hypothetical protein
MKPSARARSALRCRPVKTISLRTAVGNNWRAVVFLTSPARSRHRFRAMPSWPSGRNTKITRRSQFQTTAESVAGKRSNCRHVQPGNPVEDAVPVANPMARKVAGRKFSPSVDVRAHAKGTLALGCDHDATQRVLLAKPGQMAIELRKHGRRERVQFGWVVQPQLSNAVIDLAVHSAHSFSPIGPSLSNRKRHRHRIFGDAHTALAGLTMSVLGSDARHDLGRDQAIIVRRITQRSVT